MNWKFITKWAVAFLTSTVVYDLTHSFWMSLGILILIIVAWHLVLDLVERQRLKKRITEELFPKNEAI